MLIGDVIRMCWLLLYGMFLDKTNEYLNTEHTDNNPSCYHDIFFYTLTFIYHSLLNMVPDLDTLSIPNWIYRREDSHREIN